MIPIIKMRFTFPSLLFLIFYFLVPTNSAAQTTSDSLSLRASKKDTLSFSLAENDTVKKKNTIWQNLKYDGVTAFGAVKHTYASPFHWERKEFTQAGAVILGTVILSFADETASTFFADQGKKIPQNIKDFGWYFGSPQNNYGITGSIYFFGLFTNNEKIRRTGVLMIASATASGIIQSIAKTVAGRARPSTGFGHTHFKPFANKASNNSFPSGHTILSFTTAYSIGKQFTNPFARYGIYAFGLISPVSRLWEQQHWLTDVGLSLVMSVVVVDCIDGYLKKEKKYSYTYHDPHKIKWSLSVGVGTIGVAGIF